MPEQPDEDNRRDLTACEVGFSRRNPGEYPSALEVARDAEAFAARRSVLGVGARPNLLSSQQSSSVLHGIGFSTFVSTSFLEHAHVS